MSVYPTVAIVQILLPSIALLYLSVEPMSVTNFVYAPIDSVMENIRPFSVEGKIADEEIMRYIVSVQGRQWYGLYNDYHADLSSPIAGRLGHIYRPQKRNEYEQFRFDIFGTKVGRAVVRLQAKIDRHFITKIMTGNLHIYKGILGKLRRNNKQ